MKLNLPEAVFFDLDGTLIDYAMSRETGYLTAVKEYANFIGSPDINAIVAGIVIKADWFWSDESRNAKWRKNVPEARREIVRMVFSDLGIHLDRIAIKIADRCSEIREQTISLISGAVETLSSMKSLRIKLALITNGGKERQREKIVRFGLESMFDSIFVEEEVGFAKPDIRIYELALKALKIQRPENAWMVGDNITWDVIAPQKIGIKGFWVNPRKLKNHYNEQPFRVIDSVRDLLLLV